MKKSASQLRKLRQRAGLSLRELAHQIGEDHSNIRYWELSEKIPRSDVLVPIAKALGVSVEEILGIDTKTKSTAPRGKASLAFEAVSKLPRKKQDEILNVVNALLEQLKEKENQ